MVLGWVAWAEWVAWAIWIISRPRCHPAEFRKKLAQDLINLSQKDPVQPNGSHDDKKKGGEFATLFL